MEVKPGYIHTDVGVIPDDWSLMTYGDVFNFLSSATYSRSELTEGDDVKYVHYGDIHTKWDGYLDFSEEYLPTLESGKAKAYHLIKEGDIIMADASEDYEGVGKSVEVKNIEKNKAISGLHTFLLRDNNDVFVNGFKGYIHCNEIVKNQFYRYATGLKVFGISKNVLKSIQIPVPPKAEQTAIATALSDVDALIQSLEKLIAKKRLIKQGAMQELLKPKEGWVVKKLGEVAILIASGKSDTKSKNGNYPIYGSTGLIGYSDKFDYSGKKILVARVGINAGSVYLVDGKYCVSDNTLLVDLKNSVDLSFILCYLKYCNLNKLIYGSGQPLITGGQLKELPISLPVKEEQSCISNIISDIEAEILYLVSKLEKYKQIKQGMMQNLLTGKIRLV